MKKYLALNILLLTLPVVVTKGNVGLPAIFGDHMVLQQKSEVLFWGWAKALEEVTITASWDQIPVKVIANPNAEWKVTLKTPVAGGPYTITIKGYNTIVMNDVLIGEVWFCSGQSNMEWSAAMGIDNAEQEISKADHPQIHLFSVNHRTASTPQIDLGGSWVSCSPETMKYFSAIAYFFGRQLQEQLQVPVGLILSSWGGTPAEVWVNAFFIKEDKTLFDEAQKLQPVKWGPTEPGKAYNAMVAPLIPFRIAGALWYQGETNTYSPVTYTEVLSTLIKSWRKEWGYDFPFYYVQIAPYEYGRPMEGAVLRDAQRRCLQVPNTGMVVVSDIGNIHNIHPTNKLDVGIRLANWALNKTYGKKNIPFSGPLYSKMQIEGKKIRLYFDYAESGLISKGGELKEFEIAGEDRKFVKAEAKIEGSTVVVYNKEIKAPAAVRFAFSNTSEPNLFNQEGLPASTFRTDDWPIEIR